MARYDEITPPRSDTAMQAGGFKARDEMRRAESMTRNKLKMAERLDRNINRASRKGDASAMNEFMSVRKALTGEGYGGSGGIGNHDDREQRVKDGTIKGAGIRWDAGNIGRTDKGPINEAPPVDSVTPKNRTDWDGDGNGIPNSIQRPGLEAPAGSEGLQTGTLATSATSTPGSATESFAEMEARKRQESASSGAFGSGAQARANGTAAPNARQQFAADLDRSTAIQSDMNGDLTPEGNAARERAYARGEVLGVSREQIDKRMNFDSTEARQAKADEKEFGESDSKVNDAIANLDPSKFSPEQIAAIKKNMAGLTPKQRKESAATGKAKSEEWGKQVDEVIGRAKETVTDVQAEVARRQGVVKDLQGEIANRDQALPISTAVDSIAPVQNPSLSFISEPVSAPPVEPPAQSSISAVKSDLDWLKPGISPSKAKQSLMEVRGYTSEQADATLKGRGVTAEATKFKADKDKLRSGQLQASINKSAALAFSEQVRKNPPVNPEWMGDSLLGKAYLSIRGHDKAKIKEYERQQLQAAIAKLSAPPATLPPL